MKKQDSDWFVCRDKLAELEVGTILEFKDGVKGLVILGNISVHDSDEVGERAVLLIEFATGEFWGVLAKCFLSHECRVVGCWRAGEQK